MKRLIKNSILLAVMGAIAFVGIRSYSPSVGISGETPLALASSIIEAVNNEVPSNAFKVSAAYTDPAGINRLFVDQKGRPFKFDSIAGQQGSAAPLTSEQTLWYIVAVTGQPLENPPGSGRLMPLSPADDALLIKSIGLILKLTAQHMMNEPRNFKFIAFVVTPLVNSGSTPSALFFAVHEEELFAKSNLEWDEGRWEQFGRNHYQAAQFMPVIKVNVMG